MSEVLLKWRRQWHPTLVLLPGKSHVRRSLVGCSPWGREESDTTERLHFHFSLSRIGEGNGNPLQCSCLENPKDGGAWWAAVCGITQSQTRLKWLSSSSSSVTQNLKIFTKVIKRHSENILFFFFDALCLSCGIFQQGMLALLVACGSVVAARGLSCPAACGILVPWPGIEPHVPCTGRQIFNH